MRALVTAAIVAASLLFSSLTAHAQRTTQTWYRVEGPTPHWYTILDLEWGKTRFDAILIPNHGVTYTVRVDCNDGSGQIAMQVYGVGMIDGVYLDCINSIGKTDRNLNSWLMKVGELPPEIVSSLSDLNINGFGPPPEILD